MRKLVCLIGLLSFMPAVSTATPIEVYLDPTKIHVAPGESFTIDLLANIMPGEQFGEGIIGFGVNLGFDTSILTYTGALVTGPWAPIFNPFGASGFLALPNPSQECFPFGICGSGIVLATLGFTAISPSGTSTDIELSGSNFNFPLGGPFGGFPDPDDVEYVDGIVAVPEPNTILLLGIGLLALGWMHRRRRLPLAQ